MRQLHERVFPVQQAAAEIQMEFWRSVEKHELTYGEVVSIVSEILASAAKYMIREERHGDASKPGGLK